MYYSVLYAAIGYYTDEEGCAIKTRIPDYRILHAALKRRSCIKLPEVAPEVCGHPSDKHDGLIHRHHPFPLFLCRRQSVQTHAKYITVCTMVQKSVPIRR